MMNVFYIHPDGILLPPGRTGGGFQSIIPPFLPSSSALQLPLPCSVLMVLV